MPQRNSIVDARVLLLMGDSVTTDHISPAGSIARNSPAARYLSQRGYACFFTIFYCDVFSDAKLLINVLFLVHICFLILRFSDLFTLKTRFVAFNINQSFSCKFIIIVLTFDN